MVFSPYSLFLTPRSLFQIKTQRFLENEGRQLRHEY